MHTYAHTYVPHLVQAGRRHQVKWIGGGPGIQRNCCSRAQTEGHAELVTHQEHSLQNAHGHAQTERHTELVTYQQHGLHNTGACTV
eukprot:646754-Pelagomonas_calceolata.AAC.1